MMDQKSGVRTSEFWLTAIVNIAGAVLALLAGYGIINSEEGDLWLTLVQALALAFIPLALAYQNGKYIESRKEVKASQNWNIAQADRIEVGDMTDVAGVAIGEDSGAEVDKA